jgi:hypothetical protein
MDTIIAMTATLPLPDHFEKLCRVDPRGAFELLLGDLEARLPYRVDRRTLEAIRIALRIAWTLGQREGIRSVIDDTLEQAKESERHDH